MGKSYAAWELSISAPGLAAVTAGDAGKPSVSLQGVRRRDAMVCCIGAVDAIDMGVMRVLWYVGGPLSCLILVARAGLSPGSTPFVKCFGDSAFMASCFLDFGSFTSFLDLTTRLGFSLLVRLRR